jgi:hypothetical protein
MLPSRAIESPPRSAKAARESVPLPLNSDAFTPGS